MTLDPIKVWTIITCLAAGTYFIRWSFLGLLGDRELPEWAHRHLRYTAVAILPGLILVARRRPWVIYIVRHPPAVHPLNVRLNRYQSEAGNGKHEAITLQEQRLRLWFASAT